MQQSGIVTARRSRPRAYLALARASNLPTIWSSVLAGLAAAGAAVTVGKFVWLAFAVSLLHTGGTFLNDAFDGRIDAAGRPDRPIPAGEVGRGEIYGAGFLLLALGVLLLTSGATNRHAAASYAAALAAAIVYYDARHKQDRNGPLVIGMCRGLVYCAAAAAVATVTPVVVLAAIAVASYVTLVAIATNHGGERWVRSSAWLLAGISLVDAVVIVATGRVSLAFVAALGFPITLLSQRPSRGTSKATEGEQA